MKRLVVNKRSPVLAIALISAFSISAFSADHNFNISQQSLDSALQSFAEQSGLQMVFVSKVSKGMQAQELRGTYNEGQALKMLLADSGLGYEFIDERTVAIKPLENAGDNNSRKKGGVLGREDRVVEEMIVTAQKQEKNIKDVPISIVAIGGQELEQRKIQDFNDLAMAVPGLSVMDWGHIAQRRIYLRGLASTVGESLVGVYLDETPTVGSSVLQIDYRTYDLERVEILKGPQGTLFGQGSVGGTVRFITKNPNLQEFGGRADVSASFTEGGAPSQNIKGVLNVPLITDRLALRVSGVFESNGGWVDQPTASADDVNDSDVTNIRAKLLWQPVDNFEVMGTYSLFRMDGGLAATDGFKEHIERNEFVQAFGRLDTPSHSQDYDLYNLTINYDTGFFSIVNSASYLDITNVTENYPATNGWDYGVTLLEKYVPVVGDILTDELRFTSNSAGPLQWTFGAVYSEINRATGYDTEFGPYDGPVQGEWVFNIPLVNYDTNKSWAVFGESSYAITDNLEIGVGLRHFKEDKHSDADGDASFSATSPRIFAKYNVSEDVNLYASIGEGFRSGGFNSATLPQFKNYDPETTRSYELGSKGYLFDGRVNFDVALFHSLMDGFQIVSTVPGTPFNSLLNGGVGESNGIDWTIAWNVSDQLTLGSHGTYTDATLKESGFEGQPFDVGDRLPMVPKIQFGITLDYEFLLAGKSSLFNIEYNRKGSVVWLNRKGYFAFTGESDVIEMLNANFTWDFSDSVTLGVFAKNLLNEDGFLDPFGNLVFSNGFNEGGATAALPPRPRTFGVSLGVEF